MNTAPPHSRNWRRHELSARSAREASGSGTSAARAGSKPMVWRVGIAPEECKLFADCNRDELGAAAALIKDRARSRGLSTVGELREEEAEAARLGLMR
jgi:hypothetical protein